MSRNKLLILLLALMTLFSTALGESLISDEMIQEETVHYNHTLMVEKGVFQRSYSEQGSEYYPHTFVLRFEGNEARFVEYLVSRKQEVKAGDVLATFELDVDEVALASRRQALTRAQEAYETQKIKRQEAIQEQLEALAKMQDPFEVELQTLALQRAQITLEQYCVEQERQIETLKQEIADLEAFYSKTALIAPFDGVITELVYKQKGQRLIPGEALITLYRPDGMLLRISNSNLHFRYGMEVEIAAGPAKARTILTGRVVAADDMLSKSQRSGYAYIELDPASGEFPTRGVPPSVSANTFYAGNVYILPRQAVDVDNGKYYVTKLTDGMAQKRYINLGKQGISDSWILQGIEEGETIIID